MALFRRTLLGLVAAAALLFGFGSFTAALACPATVVSEDHSDCCAQPEQEDCVLLNCTAICQVIAPVAPGAQSASALTPAPYWGKAGVLEAVDTGPEPPPPR